MSIHTKDDWDNRCDLLGVGEPFYVTEDEFDPEDGYLGSTLYGCDGDGGRFIISVDRGGVIRQLKQYKCTYVGETDFSVEDLSEWLWDLCEHVTEMNEAHSK